MKILFAGDLLFRYFKEYIGNEAVDRLFEGVKPAFDAADYRVINLEAIFNNGFEPIIKSGPAHYALTEYVYALKAMNIDLAGLANNHTGDLGEEGVLYTMEVLKQNGIAYAGAGRNLEEAYRAHVFEKDGITVSVLAVCENEYGIAKKDFAGSAGYKLGMVHRRITEEKAKGHQVVMYFHGGNEENPFPSPGKQELYRFFIDIGADAVIAMHTHCPQGYETYKDKPIIYSMGNFYFPYDPNINNEARTNPNSSFFFGYMTELEFTDGKIGTKIIPYHFQNDGVEILIGEKLAKFNAYMEKLCAPLDDEDEIQRLFEGWCMMLGIIYARHANYSEEMMHDQIKVKNMKNAFTCEAHNELITAFMHLCYDLRTDDVAEYTQRIKELMWIPVYD